MGGICEQIPATESMEGREFIQVFEELVKIDAIPLGLQAPVLKSPLSVPFVGNFPGS